MDSAFQQTDEALKGAERRPTAQKGGAHAPPKTLFWMKIINSVGINNFAVKLPMSWKKSPKGMMLLGFSCNFAMSS